jgi:Ca2+-transporting ATPase
MQSSTEKGVWDTELTTDNAESLNRIITGYASHSLRTISLVYRDFQQWLPPGARIVDDEEVVFEDILKDLVFFSLVSIRGLLREGAQEAVQAYLKAGAIVRIVTGDNILTTKAITREYGILSSIPRSSDIAIEGAEFRSLSIEERG